MGIYIPDMDKPKSCEECVKSLDIECCGDIRNCPIIEINDEIWEALKPKVETMSLAESQQEVGRKEKR